MAKVQESERDILLRRRDLLTQKIHRERASLDHAGMPSGNSIGIPYIVGETGRAGC